MSETTITGKTFEWLEELSENNDRRWFAEHKQRYKQDVQAPFASLLEQISKRLRRTANPMSGGAETMYRIYRDVRFSKDKRPYKESVSGLMTPSGTKDESEGLLYLHLDKNGGFIATGCYQPSTKRLTQIRDAMIEEPDRFHRIVRRLQKANFTFDDGDPVKTMPRGYADHREHKLVRFLRMRHLIAREDQTKKAWLRGDVIERVIELNRAATTFNEFLFETRL